LLAALGDGGVDFVLIGGVAGGSYGSTFRTFDVDVAYSRDGENLERLVGVLNELRATLRGAPPGLPFHSMRGRSARRRTSRSTHAPAPSTC
jgi:hypothetical protein